MKVNMTPNPLDVVTIHASQGDSEARQWEFELHNNGELIDTSEVTEQLFFKSYKGGTEQILPENTSTPTTSPFNGDIKYPQGLLTDQEFTYRQSPTEEDGNAKITDIKGNTLVWNQLFKIYSPTTVTTNGVTFVTNADGTVTLNGTATARTAFVLTAVTTSNGLLTSNHIYYMVVCPKGGSQNTYFGGVAGLVIDTGNGGLWRYNYTWDSSSLRIDIFEGVTFNNVSFKPQYIDLTLLFGAEKAEEILAMGQAVGIAYFRSLFPLPYYAYNQGSLLSFNGNGIKTVGKNRWDSTRLYGASSSVTLTNGVYVKSANSNNWLLNVESNSAGAMPVLFEANQSIVLSYKIENSTVNSAFLCVAYEDGTTRNFPNAFSGFTTVLPKKVVKAGIVLYGTFTANSSKIYDIQLEIGTSATSYEPYTSSTLSLPISTYFPNGMKSAGNVYDELTESKAITRIGVVDLGTLTWNTPISANPNIFFCNSGPEWINLIGERDNAICSKYERYDGPISGALLNTRMLDKQFVINKGNKGITGNFATGSLLVKDSSYSTVQEFKTAMSGVYLYYELKTPTETSFTTASLVTENTEIPLSNEDGILIGKCTEELSAEPGFHDAKIKLTDSDGTCYSNKLQLHVERSPQ